MRACFLSSSKQRRSVAALQISLFFLFFLATPLFAVVVRPAPNVNWIDSAGRLKGLSIFRGQPIVLVIAPTPRSWAFRSQLGQLRKMYERYAAEKVVFIAAFTQEVGRIRSNIPFVLAADGPRVGFDYGGYGGSERFTIAFIGKDGNLDYVTDRVIPAQRIFDVINNSFVIQRNLRRP
jgi:hypothetical protein